MGDKVPFRAGDVVYHRPSGETWVVASVRPQTSFGTGGDFMACGWPETCAKSEDCDVRHRCTDEEHSEMLIRVANSRSEGGCTSQRSSWAERNLAELREEPSDE